MEDIIAERERKRREVIEKARAYVNSLKGRYSAFLIGSYARGDFNVWSDIDVLLIGDFRGNPLERLLGLDFPPNFEVIPLTEEEFHKALEKNNPITWDVRSKGVVLRDDLGLCEKYNISCFRDVS
ncbi:MULTISPECIES: nucleotidyltransferase domain-containing protein [unclassified Stygiolobus]|uniref:nucleotidyltransferase domain-containing protein n=1 Tax=unclassified Stygiolobus TaxID=2824672 RepID=UPI00307D2033